MSDITLVNGNEVVPNDHVELALAVRLDHPCDDFAGCDIARAWGEGFTLTAAWLLRGATETPTVDRVLAAHPELMAEPWPADFDDWKAFHDQYGRKCEACESYSYGDDSYTPHTCHNCGASMTVA